MLPRPSSVSRRPPQRGLPLFLLHPNSGPLRNPSFPCSSQEAASPSRASSFLPQASKRGASHPSTPDTRCGQRPQLRPSSLPPQASIRGPHRGSKNGPRGGRGGRGGGRGGHGYRSLDDVDPKNDPLGPGYHQQRHQVDYEDAYPSLPKAPQPQRQQQQPPQQQPPQQQQQQAYQGLYTPWGPQSAAPQQQAPPPMQGRPTAGPGGFNAAAGPDMNHLY